MKPTSSGPSIIATNKQSRFHLLDDRPAHEIDVETLTIIVTSPSSPSSARGQTEGEEDKTTTTTTTKSKSARAKAKSSKISRTGTEILVDAHLRLKSGVTYGLIGRNGTGKSTLLRAMAEKRIPGIPHATRIGLLQQTDIQVEDDEDLEIGNRGVDGTTQGSSQKRDKTVLEQVMSSDRVRNELVRDINVLSKSFETEDPLEPVRAIRKIRHQQLEKQLFLAEKNADYKSGARGMQARKDLIAIEDKFKASQELLSQNADQVDAEATQADTQSAVDTLQALQAQFEAIKLVDVEQQAKQILMGLGFKEAQLTKPYKSLSGGWRMRCMLASILIQNLDVVILDEPTNFLDLLGVVWLENYLQKMRESSQTIIVIVSHDRDFVDSVCDEIVILRDQRLSYFRGNLSAYEKDFADQKLYWGRMKEAQDRQKAHMEATIRENIKVGRKTGDDNKLRLAKQRQKKVDDRMGIQVSAKGTRFKLNRDMVGYFLTGRAEIEVPEEERGVAIAFPEASELRFPGPLVSLEGVTFRYKPAEAPVLTEINLVIHIGDRVGIMGLNGSGKSTLVRLLAGITQPTRGKVTTHPRLKLGYYSQHAVEELQELGQVEPALTSLAFMTKETDGAYGEGDLRGLLSSLGLQGRIASDVPISQLSGGQLVRLALAKAIWKSPHLLILDEISTHLDFYTVTALASALSWWKGAIVLISHDRFLVRSLIEGKRDEESKLDDDFEGVEEDEQDASQSRRRMVYVVESGRLQEQQHGVDQFEQSLAKRVQKMLATIG